jgi:hypothetical protein
LFGPSICLASLNPAARDLGLRPSTKYTGNARVLTGPSAGEAAQASPRAGRAAPRGRGGAGAERAQLRPDPAPRVAALLADGLVRRRRGRRRGRRRTISTRKRGAKPKPSSSSSIRRSPEAHDREMWKFRCPWLRRPPTGNLGGCWARCFLTVPGARSKVMPCRWKRLGEILVGELERRPPVTTGVAMAPGMARRRA